MSEDVLGRLRNSPANELLFEIMLELVQPAALIRQFIEDHDACSCQFCRQETSGGSLMRGLVALDWSLSMVAKSVSAAWYGTPDKFKAPEQLPRPYAKAVRV
jgi:hypothetical protein